MKHRGWPRSAALVLLAAAAVGAALAARRFLRQRSRPARQRALSRRRPGPTTQSLVTVTPADMPLGEPGHNTELRLDEALQETFPGSDPIATQIE
ncbi:MAG: hypothetical protein ACTHM9_14115 [Gemmatimonadales bacterium]